MRFREAIWASMLHVMRTARAPGLLLLAATAHAGAQPACNRPVGPDLIIADIAGVANYGASGGRAAWSVGTRQVNVGNAAIGYSGTTSQHPIEGQALFRLTTTDGAMRFEQIGRSWLFHGFLALPQNGPCATCQGAGGSTLGVGCASADTATATGSQPGLGPAWQVNPYTGQFAFPPASPPYAGPIARRLQAAIADVAPDASYFVEVHAIAPDDAAAGNGANNASYRPCSFAPATNVLILSGATTPEQPAIAAWRAADPLVTQSEARVPGEGLFIVSSRATDLGNGAWRYEYAVYNMNSELAAGSFSVPLPVSASLTNSGFHDVDYTDGDGINSVNRDGTDWPASRTGAVTWATTPFATDPNANALRWGTLYNFRFDSSAPPAAGLVNLGLWKSPGVALAVAAQVPGSECYANCDGSTGVPVLTVNDFICFQNRFAAGDPYANCNRSTGDPVLNINDFVCFQARFAAGCP
jgi:hypothetical protein